MHALKKVELQDNVLRHVTADDFLPTVATSVDLIRQEIPDQHIRDLLEDIAYELMFAHEAFKFQLR